jgi:tRNA threonylcarbamoyladenosine biosynthesis protein TsaB
MLLAIDSSLGTSVALVATDGELLREASSFDPRAYAETIGALIKECLSGLQGNHTPITGVVMGVGPGPFTGLRVGMAAAHALSLSLQVPLYPVVSHDALGWLGDSDCVVTTDARRGEVAYSVYKHDVPFRRIDGPTLVRPDHLDEALGDWVNVPRPPSGEVSAATLARVALEFITLGLPFPAPTPIYLREPDVGGKA